MTEREIERAEAQHDPFRCQWPNVPRASRAVEDTREAPEFYRRDERDISAEESAADMRVQAGYDELANPGAKNRGDDGKTQAEPSEGRGAENSRAHN